jgi:HlyD family secretion protein
MIDPFLPTGVAPAVRPSPTPAMDRRVAGSRWSRLKRWRWLLLALVIGGAGWAALRLVPSSNSLSVAADEITIGRAEPAAFEDYLPVRATVAPLHSVFVDAIEAGQVSSVPALDGATVQAGQVLATLTNPQLQLDVSSREAAITGQLGSSSAEQLALQQTLATERSAIAETSYNLLKAQRDLSVRRELHDQGFESDASVKNFSDDAHYYANRLTLLRTAYAHDTALAQRQTAQLDDTERRLRGNLDDVQSSLGALTIRAPLAGRLTDFQVQPGQTVKQGDALGQIDSADAFRLDADIDEFYLGRINEGETATAIFGTTSVVLRVSRVHPQVTNGQFHAELSFTTSPPSGLRRGQTVDLRITLGQTQIVLVVANGPWLEASGGNFIFVLDRDGRHAARRAITSGRRNPEQVEITSGLTPGERVITSSYARFQNFARLLIG